MQSSSISHKWHFFIGGYFGWGNLGDELILWQIVQDLKNLMPECEITVWTNDSSFTQQWVHTNTIEYNNIDQLFKAIKESITHVIVGGGGLIQDYFSLSLRELFSEFKPRPANYILPALAGKYYGKPVFIWSQGLGPLRSEEGKHFAKLFLSLADSGTFRDQESYLLADSLTGSYHNFHIDVDPATALNLNSLLSSLNLDNKINNKPNHRGDSKQLKIGINIRPFMGMENIAIKLINQIIEEINHSYQDIKSIMLIPIPFDIKEDISSLKLFITKFESPNVTINSAPLEKPSFKNSISNMLLCDSFIGMRLHSILMAWKLNIPTIGLSYDPKVSNFCRRYNIPVIDLSTTEPINSALLKGLLTGNNYQTDSLQLKYLTPKVFSDFIAQTHKQRTVNLSEAIIIGKNHSSLMSQYNDIVNSKAFRLISQYYRFANWIKQLFS